MDIVVDTNVIAAAIVKPGITRSLLLNSDLHLYSPDYLGEELERHRHTFMKKSGLDQDSYSRTVETILSLVRQVDYEIYSLLESKAREAAPDPDDWPFLALSMSMNCALWSNDKRLKKQEVCAVYDTSGLLRLLQG